MTKHFFFIVILFALTGCSEFTTKDNSSEEPDTLVTDTIPRQHVVDTSITSSSISNSIPEDLYELDTVVFRDDQLTDFKGKVMFYSFEDSVAFRDFNTGETKHLATKDLNGKKLDIEKTYQVMEYTSYYECCDPWSEEEFCMYFLLVKTPELHGFIRGDYLHELPEIFSEKVDLIDTTNGNSYAFYTAENFKGCYRQLLLLENGDEQFHILPLFEGEFDAGVLQLYGEWTNIRSTFFRNNHPVVLVTDGVDGNYTYTFYEILKQGDQYIANRYYETYVMVTLDEFDNGFDFDSVLHEEYKIANDGEDFPYN